MAMTGYAQGRTQSIQLPRGGYMVAPQFSGYGGHDPYLNAANPYANGASQAGALGMGSGLPGGGYGVGSQFGAIGANAGIMGAASGYAAAQDANKALEEELKTGYDARTKRGVDALNTLSDQSLLDVNKIFDERTNKLKRQFGGGTSANQSTVLAGVLTQNESERGAALNRARDALTIRRVGMEADLSGDALRQRESITNAYPDLGLASQLAQKAGAAQAPMPPEPPEYPQQMPQGYMNQSNQGPSMADFKMTPAQQKQANRIESYDKSRAKRVAAYGSPITANSRSPAVVPTTQAETQLAMNSQGGHGRPYGGLPSAPPISPPKPATYPAAVPLSGPLNVGQPTWSPSNYALQVTRGVPRSEYNYQAPPAASPKPAAYKPPLSAEESRMQRLRSEQALRMRLRATQQRDEMAYNAAFR